MLQRLRRRVAPDGTLRRDLVRLVFFDLPAWSAAGARGILPALAALRRTAQREWLPLAAAAPARFVAMLCAAAGLREPLNDHAYEFARFRRARRARYATDTRRVRCVCEPGLVSVVLPVHNGALYVREAIDSVLAQDHAAWELLIVDDGSTDATPEIVAGCAARDGRIRVLRQVNRKLPAALNTGFAAARGEYLTWLSDDNRFKPSFLARMVACLRRNPGWDMIYANLDIIDEQGRPLRGADWYADRQRPPGSEHICLPHDASELNLWGNNHVGAAFLYRAAVAHLIGPYDERRFGVEDYDYWMRINAVLTLRHADFDDPVYDYRLHRNSLTARDAEIGITRGRAALMAFERVRRACWLAPLAWAVSYDADDLRAASWAARLAALARRAGHLRAVELDPAKAPARSAPSARVRITSNQSTVPDANARSVDGQVLVYVGHRPLRRPPAGWSLTVATEESLMPAEAPGERLDWLVIADAQALFSAIDVRIRAEHLLRGQDTQIETGQAGPRKSAVADWFRSRAIEPIERRRIRAD